jgi:hypothetical protein
MTEIVITSPTGPDAPVVEQAGTRPDNVPEKFWDAEKGTVNTEALLASYTALESKVGAPKPEGEAKPEGEQEGSTDEDTSEQDEAAQKLANEAGVDVEAIEAAWLESKTIPEAELAKLAKVGVTKEMAEEFIAYREAQAERLREELTSVVGGEDAVNKMVDWAGKNYTPEKAEAFNKAVNSKDKGQIEMALKALQKDYEKANGRVPKLLKPTTGAPNVGSRYESLAQLHADQRDPRYASDPAFRQAVIDKLSRSNI